MYVYSTHFVEYINVSILKINIVTHYVQYGMFKLSCLQESLYFNNLSTNIQLLHKQYWGSQAHGLFFIYSAHQFTILSHHPPRMKWSVPNMRPPPPITHAYCITPLYKLVCWPHVSLSVINTRWPVYNTLTCEVIWSTIEVADCRVSEHFIYCVPYKGTVHIQNMKPCSFQACW